MISRLDFVNPSRTGLWSLRTKALGGWVFGADDCPLQRSQTYAFICTHFEAPSHPTKGAHTRPAAILQISQSVGNPPESARYRHEYPLGEWDGSPPSGRQNPELPRPSSSTLRKGPSIQCPHLRKTSERESWKCACKSKSAKDAVVSGTARRPSKRSTANDAKLNSERFLHRKPGSVQADTFTLQLEPGPRRISRQVRNERRAPVAHALRRRNS